MPIMSETDVARKLAEIKRQPRCAPPSPTEHRLHWVRRGDDEFDVWTWLNDVDAWHSGMRMSPQYAYAAGWRYVGVAAPPA